MAVNSAKTEEASIPAHQIYKDLGMSLKDFKAKCAEVGITIKGAISKLTEEEYARLRKHLGLDAAAAEAPAPVEAAEAPKVDEKAAREEAERKQKEEAEHKRLEAIGAKLNARPEHVEFIAQVLGVELERPEDVDEQIITRAQKLDVVFKLSAEFNIIPREVARIARSLGLEVGRKGFKGLSPNEEFMLRAMVKQKHTTQEERLAEVRVEQKPEYKPAPPTGNKAVEPKPAPAAETQRKERRGRVTQEQTREVIPERFREQAGKGRGAANASRSASSVTTVRAAGVHAATGAKRKRKGSPNCRPVRSPLSSRSTCVSSRRRWASRPAKSRCA
ncbi:MAG: hypothetical protein M5U25_04525 [Planctomycetota bacterium]|nr:hypothetical protein [Planctomycetota bacterium]